MAYTWREELAWAAGFFDGEGWTSISRARGSKSQPASLGIDQRHIGVLYRFKNAVLGIGKIYDYPDKLDGKSMYTYKVNGGLKVQAVVAMLWEFLGDIKREQAADVLRNCTWIGSGMCTKNKHLLEKYGTTCKDNKRCRECNNEWQRNYYAQRIKAA